MAVLRNKIKKANKVLTFRVTQGWHLWEATRSIRFVIDCTQFFHWRYYGKTKGPQGSMSQCCSRFWNPCLRRYLTMWLASSMINLITFNGMIHMFQLGFLNETMFTQSNHCLSEHQLFTKVIKLIFCCNSLASKSSTAVSNP